MAIIDVISFNGERELFDLRYNILSPYVDEFIVVEFDKTFSGKEKPWYSEEIIKAKYKKPIYIFQCSESDYRKYFDEAKKSPNTQYGRGANHWVREWAQKEYIKDCLENMEPNDNDMVFIGDCDEIWMRDANFETATKLKLKVYTYWLNNRSSEEFWGTLVAPYKKIKKVCLNELRQRDDIKTIQDYGWHFTSLKDNLRQKLLDSYTEETYANKWVLDNLDKNIAENKDFLGRDFKYWTDESDWPQYLKDHKKKYIKLCKSLT